MKERERGEYYTLGAVLALVEGQTARREALLLGELRVLVRVAALTHQGAIVYPTDLQRAGLSNRRNVWATLNELLKKQCLRKEGGGPHTSYLVVTSKGERICADYASAWRRAGTQLEAFEVVKPYQRLKPRKN